MDDAGNSTVADVIAACDWILQNRSTYNIRVANLSLHAGSPGSVFFDPLDQAVERLWLDGVVVVAAVGNYGHDGEPSDVPFAPGNDPFVITVGGSDVHDTMQASDDDAAPWSAWGYTLDGFAKPELAAPGRYVIGPSPSDSTLAEERPDHVVGHDLIQLSGTSFSAPAVAGAAALILAGHPTWTPDQVKGALMVSARAMPAAAEGSLGVGALDVAAARAVTHPPNPNAGLAHYVVADANGAPVFDAAAWQAAAESDVAWGGVAWGDVAWGDVAWGDAAWSDAAWASAAWVDVAWGDVAWGDVAWGDAAWGDSKPDPFLPATPITAEERDPVLAELGLAAP
jgi:serine protease AprX